MTDRSLLAIIPGEPAGVGPELTVRALTQAQPADVLVLANAATLATAATALGIELEIRNVDALNGIAQSDRDWQRAETGRALVHDIKQEAPTVLGRLDVRNAQSVATALNLGSDLALSGVVAGLVTGPTHKAVLRQAGLDYLGTTEWLAQRAQTPVVMMLAHARMRVALLTTHVPLRAVADTITPQLLERVVRIVNASMMTDYGIAHPQITVLGLNPHAGESGELGSEEQTVFNPVLQSLRDQGLHVSGPLPADTAFVPQNVDQTDVIVAAYHDQGLPVLKYSGFETAVNVTLGLPYPRVAVDHGTALDLAGTGRALDGSFLQAIRECARIAAHRRQ